jgi:hypothetical protein
MRCSCSTQLFGGALHTAGLFVVQLDDEVRSRRLFGRFVWSQADEAREPQADAPVRVQVTRRRLDRRRRADLVSIARMFTG